MFLQGHILSTSGVALRSPTTTIERCQSSATRKQGICEEQRDRELQLQCGAWHQVTEMYIQAPPMPSHQYPNICTIQEHHSKHFPAHVVTQHQSSKPIT
jgi:hypothetical protein